jgi:hypothetical protein
VLCPVVTKLVTALKQQKPASAFCSSYLRIPVVTLTSTQTETRSDETRVVMVPLLTKATAWPLPHHHFRVL